MRTKCSVLLTAVLLGVAIVLTSCGTPSAAGGHPRASEAGKESRSGKYGKDQSARTCVKCGENKDAGACCKAEDDARCGKCRKEGGTVGCCKTGASPDTAKKAATKSIANTVCPVLVGVPVNKELYVDHEGRRVYFCCRGCITAFKNSPGKYLKKLP